MKILFVTTKSPLPINDGHSLRTFNLLKAAAENHEVTLLSFVKFPVEYDYTEELQAICSSVAQFPVPDNCSTLSAVISAGLNIPAKIPYVAAKYDLHAMRVEIRRLMALQKFDLVHLDMLPLGVFLNEFKVPVLLNQHNVESELLKRRCQSTSNPIVRWYLTGQQERLQFFEGNTVRRVSHVIACSPEDKLLLQSMAPGQMISVVPNGVDTDFYHGIEGSSKESCGLVFVGGMNWFPNRDGVEWFHQSVMPELTKLEPSAHLDVIGRTVDGMKTASDGGVTMHGFVPDTRPFLDAAAVVVVPIRIGGGTRLKVLEAMSMGKAIVSTTVGVEGIEVQHRKHVLIANTPAEFACAISELIRGPRLRRALGCAARQMVCDRYRWESIGHSLLEAYNKTVRVSD